jgi:hypothetical protein
MSAHVERGDGNQSKRCMASTVFHRDPAGTQNEKRPPGNRAALSTGRIVPTEASHQNFPGAIVWAAKGGVKAKSREVASC